MELIHILFELSQADGKIHPEKIKVIKKRDPKIRKHRFKKRDQKNFSAPDYFFLIQKSNQKIEKNRIISKP